MGLLIVGVLAGILIGFAWIAPSGHLEGCTFQWQGCFDQVGPSQPATPQGTPQATPQGTPQGTSQGTSQGARHGAPPREDSPTARAESLLAAKRARHASAKHWVALAKQAAEPAKIKVSTAERRPAETSDPVLERAKASIAAKMENPASAEFSNMDRAFRKNTFGRATDTICGHVRGKTASGGDTGERPFLYLVKEDDAYVVDGKPDSAAAIAYRNICN
jgi:hypothetical protein